MNDLMDLEEKLKQHEKWYWEKRFLCFVLGFEKCSEDYTGFMCNDSITGFMCIGYYIGIEYWHAFRRFKAWKTGVNKQDDKGRTAYMIACFKGDDEKMESLFNNGADPELKDNNGLTAKDYLKGDPVLVEGYRRINITVQGVSEECHEID